MRRKSVEAREGKEGEDWLMRVLVSSKLGVKSAQPRSA